MRRALLGSFGLVLLLSGCAGDGGVGGRGGGDDPDREATGGETTISAVGPETCATLTDADASTLVGREVRLKTKDAFGALSCTWVSTGDDPSAPGLTVVVSSAEGDLDDQVEAFAFGQEVRSDEPLEVAGMDARLVVTSDDGIDTEVAAGMSDGVLFMVLPDERDLDDVRRVATGALTVLAGGDLPADAAAPAPSRPADGCRAITTAEARAVLGTPATRDRIDRMCVYRGRVVDLMVSPDEGSLSAADTAALFAGDEPAEQVEVPGLPDAWIGTQDTGELTAYADTDDATWTLRFSTVGESATDEPAVRRMALDALAALAR